MTATMRAKKLLKDLENFNSTVGNVLDSELQGHLDSAAEGLAFVVEDLSAAKL